MGLAEYLGLVENPDSTVVDFTTERTVVRQLSLTSNRPITLEPSGGVTMEELLGVPAGTTGGTNTIGGFYGNLVSEMGIEAARAGNELERTEFLLSQLHVRREEVSGVSLDEESVNLIKLQTAMHASSRLINTVDEMLEVLLSI
jgi:flagellar hook-associated protein FlgK